MDVGIIGAGIGGMACAIRLACSGHKVEVFETNNYPGGKLAEIQLGNYRFDTGPSLFTLPGLVDDLFTLAGEDPRDYFSYRKLDTNCHYFFSDSTFIKAYADSELFACELAAKTTDSTEAVNAAIHNSRRLYERLSDLFMFSSLRDPRTYLSRKAFRAYGSLHRLGFTDTMDGANSKLFADKRTVQLFNRYATYNGSSPYKAPATMNIIPHLEMSLGAYFPEGGMHAITQAVFDLAWRCGVRFHFNTRIRKIVVSKKRVAGLGTDEKMYPFDRVVSNADMVSTYRRLMPEIPAPELLLRQPKSSSALIFYWGIKRKFDQLDLHNIFFSADYRKEFEYIFDRGIISEDPTVYLNITSKYHPADAPEYGENWFTMINVPDNQGQDWDHLISKARVDVLQKLSRHLKVDVEGLIEEESVLDPRIIELKTSSAGGALYGNSSNNLFSAFLRHPNVSRRVRGLYFCGGSVHPGGGIPMCLASAKLVAKYFR